MLKKNSSEILFFYAKLECARVILLVWKGKSSKHKLIDNKLVGQTASIGIVFGNQLKEMGGEGFYRIIRKLYQINL